jgi:hypothetical protein
MTITRTSFDIRILVVLASCLFALASPGLANAAEAGKFQFVIGDIKVISASGAKRTPVKGEAFSPGETIITGASGSAQIRMTDGGLVAVRADTEMKLDQYVFNGREDGSERKLVSLIKGGFRAITGLIGNRNKQNYKILTPSATIGIRGTDHEAVVIPPNATGGFQAGTYDRVYRGATIIETDKGKLIVNPNQVGFTPGKGVAPVLLPKIPEFFEASARKPDAAKDSRKDSKDAEGDDSKKSDTSRGTSVRSLSTLKNNRGTVKDADAGKDPNTTLRSPLDATTVKDLGTTTLTTPLSDTTLKPTSTVRDTTLTSPLKSDALIEPITVPTTTLKTDVLTAPTTTTTTTIKAPTTTTITSPITTTIAPITTTTKITEPVIAPTTTTILKSPTTTTTISR